MFPSMAKKAKAKTFPVFAATTSADAVSTWSINLKTTGTHQYSPILSLAEPPAIWPQVASYTLFVSCRSCEKWASECHRLKLTEIVAACTWKVVGFLEMRL